jgi:glycine/D-amino acid oxidase-like deaminating enzyme
MWDRALLPLARRGQEIVASLVPVRRVGMAQVALSRGTAKLVARLDGREMPRALERAFRPEFARRIVRASFSPSEFWIENAALIRALTRDLAIVPRLPRDADRVVVATASVGRPERAVLARASVRVPSMFHVVDTGLYMREDLAGDTTMANVRATLADATGAACRFLRADTVAMSPRPIVRRRGNVWTFGGFAGDGLALAPALGERLADDLLR